MKVTTIQNLRQFEKLTASELTRLKKRILGYGNFRRTAIELGTPEKTLRDVLNRGYGSPETISKIRGVDVSASKVA